MLAIASLIFAVVPMSIYLWIVWLMDRYDREPLGLLLKNFAWGAIGAIFFGILFSVFLSAILESNAFENAVFVAPFAEEISKGVFLLYTARDRRFDNITDGIVYGMAIGLGFGMTENFLYFMGAKTVDDWAFLVIARTLFSAVMHAVATGTLGAFIGLTKFQARNGRWYLRILGLLIAMGMHLVWNRNVSIESTTAIAVGILVLILSVIVLIVVFQLSLLSESRIIRRELTEEATDGFIPAVHVQFIPYSSKRRMLGWLPVTIDRKTYISLATRLAFRKFQMKHCREEERESYQSEVQSIRDQITQLFSSERESLAAKLF